jgi:hypothetical protein
MAASVQQHLDRQSQPGNGQDTLKYWGAFVLSANAFLMGLLDQVHKST